VALRANFATLDKEGRVVDRRAGRIREHTDELAAALDNLVLPGNHTDGIKVLVRPTTEHRLAVVLRGPGLSSAIQGSDPGDGAPPGPPQVPKPLDPGDERAVRAARVLALFEQEARRVLARHPLNKKRQKARLLPANAVLTRGAGHIHRLIPLEQAGLPLRITCISGDRTILGIASWLGAETVEEEGMTANLDTDLRAKFDAALKALRKRDLVVLHLKGADIAAHDRRPDLKATFLERADRELARLIKKFPDPLRIAVGADHATLSESGQHAADPVPVLLWGEDIAADEVETYDEQSVATGALQRFPLQLLIPRLYEV
jgi:2,3-bisphosphoglycerate-independent phosphoglycerate mutase